MSDLLVTPATAVTASHSGGTVFRLEDWSHPADDIDRAMLALCVGATLDVGCGPGRLAAHLASRGHVVLGIDITDVAVDGARRRGVPALRRDVFAPLPGEGRWQTALLADGTIGIGGDPRALLRRLAQVLRPDGRVVVELAAAGAAPGPSWAVVHGEDHCRERFGWTVVGVDQIDQLAAATGFTPIGLHRWPGRRCAVLEPASPARARQSRQSRRA